MPKLRFPEFRVDTTWLAPQLADLYGFKRTNTLSRDNLNYEFGTIRNIHYGDIHTKFKPLFRLENEHVPYVNLDVAPDGFDDEAFCEEGDIVLADASEDLDGVGKAIEVVSLNGERVVAGTHTILATRRGSVPVVGFGGQLFQSAAVRTGIKREAQGAKVYGISANRISAIPVPVPPTEAEQQRIATCLSSLEDVLAAQARKIEALRQHKQGLMQQLFPQPGETVPRLRFPEFSEEGAWDETTIGNMGEVITGSTPSTSRRDFYGGDFMFVSPADISDLRFVEETKTTLTEAGFAECRPIKKNSVLFVCIGSTIGKVAQCSRPCATNQQINSLVASPAFVADFAYYLLDRESVRIARLAGKQAVPIINKSLFATVKVTAPVFAEQQRIADCLSSLDARLAAQVQKINALKTHKQGLLQQLFPSPEAV